MSGAGPNRWLRPYRSLDRDVHRSQQATTPYDAVRDGSAYARTLTVNIVTIFRCANPARDAGLAR
jgi:hypothetical protein